MKALAAGAAAVVLAPVLFIAAITGSAGVERTWGLSGGPLASAADVPVEMWALYQEAASRFGIPTGLLAAVGKVECDHNRNPACAAPNAVGAVGPMQFLPTTFAAWSWATGDPTPSPLEPRDAVLAAAAKLTADGAADDPSRALFAYNHSNTYVATVEAWALAYGWVPPDPAVLASAVLSHPHLALRSAAATDVRNGLVDDRVLGALLVVATRHELTAVGPFVSGHSYYVDGTDRPSNHVFGRAVDLPVVDGEAVGPDNTDARTVVDALVALPESLRPDELGCPWLLSAPGVRSFTEGHADHIHLGYGSASS